MSRSTPEWVGKNDDVTAPPRVQLRRLLYFGRTCQICFMPIVGKAETDHQVALINGGENRERNLVPVHPKCHKIKTLRDLSQKAATARTQKSHYGLKKPRHRWGYGKNDDMKKKLSGEVVPRER
jgi:5-methylcytosine-specific restriction protein A